MCVFAFKNNQLSRNYFISIMSTTCFFMDCGVIYAYLMNKWINKNNQKMHQTKLKALKQQFYQENSCLVVLL